MSGTNEILNNWNKIKELVEALELDVQKSITGIVQAGARARIGVREVQKLTRAFVKASLAQDKVVRLARKAKKNGSTPTPA